jgi:hypothetical protein
MRTNVLVVAISVLSLVGCGGSGSGEGALSPDELAAQQAALAPPPPPPTPARVRVIHASVDSLLASLSVYVDGAPTPIAGGIAAGSAALTELPPGVHQFGVRPAEGDAATPALFEFTTSSLAEGVPYTFVVHGLAGSAGATLGIVAAADDTAPGASGDTVPARFFHAIAGVGPVDVCKPGARTRDAATPIFANVTYGTFGTPSGEGARGTWANVSTGVASRIQVRSAHASRPCSGNVVGNASIAFDSGAATTLVGTGRHGQGRRDPGTPKQILVCGAGSASCSAVALSAR